MNRRNPYHSHYFNPGEHSSMLERHAASLVRKLPATSTSECILPITKKMCTAYVRKTGLRVPGGNATDTVDALHDTCVNVRYERLYRQSMRAKHAALMEKENTPLRIRIINRLYRPYLPRIAELLAPRARFYSSYPWLSLQRGECAVSYTPSRRVGFDYTPPRGVLALPTDWRAEHRRAPMEVHATIACNSTPYLVLRRTLVRQGEHAGLPWSYWSLTYVKRTRSGPELMVGGATEFCGGMWLSKRFREAHLELRMGAVRKFVKRRLAR